VSLRPDEPAIFFKLGLALADQGNLEEAAANYEKAATLYQKKSGEKFNYGVTLNNLALVYSRLGRLDDALTRIDLAVAAWPRDAAFFVSRGLILEAKGNMDEALSAYRKALAFSPRSADVLIRLGAALQKEGQVDEALSVLRRAVLVKPFDAEVFAALGDALAAGNHLDDAIAAYGRSLEIRPDTPAVLWPWGMRSSGEVSKSRRFKLCSEPTGFSQTIRRHSSAWAALLRAGDARAKRSRCSNRRRRRARKEASSSLLWPAR
jgi:tetratricopeptide (TPR) repeat protein